MEHLVVGRDGRAEILDGNSLVVQLSATGEYIFLRHDYRWRKPRFVITECISRNAIALKAAYV